MVHAKARYELCADGKRSNGLQKASLIISCHTESLELLL